MFSLLENLLIASALWGWTYGKLNPTLVEITRNFINVQRELTRNHITGIHRIIILDEAEAVHELDLGDVTSAVLEVALDVFLGHCKTG